MLTFRLFKERKGFSLVELVVVIAIIAVISVAAIPSVIAFLSMGLQENRDNIARTLYVAAQSRLTELRVTKNLRSELTEDYYDSLGNIKTPAAQGNNLYVLLGGDGGGFPPMDNANKEHVVAIVKNKGDLNPNHPVYKLLYPLVLDKDIYNNTICVEYNFVTGVVLSVFYSDVADTFVYKDAAVPETDISGERPYRHAAARKQGYYGVDYTGEAEEPPLPDVINIYDGAEKPLAGVSQNVLYAEALIPDTKAGESYSFGLLDASTKAVEGTGTGSYILSSLTAYFYDTPNEHIVYKDSLSGEAVNLYGIDVSGSYNKYIWIIDYVDGDIYTTENSHSIKTKYGIDAPRDLRAYLQGGGETVSSLTTANAYYAGVASAGNYYVKSGRHLSNVRFEPASGFSQLADIDLDGITNFKPIDDFSGAYAGKMVSGLKIDNSGVTGNPANAGLFSNILPGGKVSSLFLKNAEIKAAYGGNAGSIAGYSQGTITLSKAMAGITVGGGAGASAGGLVGELGAGGIIDRSYNGGYFDSTGREAANPLTGFVSVTGTYSGTVNIGGLVGLNKGTVQNSYNNARANIFSAEQSGAPEYLSVAPIVNVSLTAAAANIGGIAGNNEGAVKNTYATNNVAAYAGSTPGGIVGAGIAPENSYFLFNGAAGGGAVTKADLRGKASELSAEFGNGKAFVEGNNTTEYPYPVLNANPHVTEWENIEEIINSKSFGYYELYSNGTWGYSETLEGNIPLIGYSQSVTVVNDGYFVEFPFADRYTLTLGGDEFEITGEKVGMSVNWTVPGGWLAPQSFTYTDSETGNTETAYRLFIPNSVGEAESAGNNAVVPVTFNVNGVTDILEGKTFYAPLFGKAVLSSASAPTRFSIRSPRQMDNIDKIGSASRTYTQELDLDFASYKKELTISGMNYIGLTSSGLTFNEPVVTLINLNLPFTGVYDGDYKRITGLKINSSKNYTGLFQVNAGRINNVRLISPVIESLYSGAEESGTGGIAGRNNGEISGCSVEFFVTADRQMSIEGKDNVGGIAGRNAHTITGSFVRATRVGSLVEYTLIEGSGENAGGIAGLNEASGGNPSINKCYVDFVQVKGGSTAGGIVGRVENGSVSSVFYNYANADPQSYNFKSTVTQTAGGLAGGLAGYMGDGCYLYDGYSNAYINPADGSPVVGAAEASATFQKVYYLSEEEYNDSGSSIPGISSVNILGLRQLAGDLGGDWENGPSWKGDETPEEYPYPILSAVKDNTPLYFPMPGAITYRLKYYEKYSDGSYGLWGGPEDDYLSDDKRIIEDGYVIQVADTVSGSLVYELQKADGTILSSGSETLATSVQAGYIEPGGGFSYFVLDTGECEENAQGLEPIRVRLVNSEGVYIDSGFNPLFAKAVFGSAAPPDGGYSNYEYIIRSPRQMENIATGGNADKSDLNDDTLGGKYRQEVDIDFDKLNNDGGYQKRTKIYPADSPEIPIDVSGSIVRGGFKGSYTGLTNNKMKAIRNAALLRGASGNIDTGIFSAIEAGGSVSNIILENNEISNSYGNVGGVAGVNKGKISNILAANKLTGTLSGSAGGIAGINEGTIEYCEVSPKETVSGTVNAGGIVGENASGALVENVYFNSAKREAGLYVTPIEGTSANKGGLAGKNAGDIKTAYSTALAPSNKPTIGVSDGGVITDVYYLVSNGFNFDENADAGQGEAKLPYELAKLNLNAGWGTQSTLYQTELKGISYPFPKLRNMPHYHDWPVFSILKYYEIYTDNTVGYYYVEAGQKVDLLKNNDRVAAVNEEGYMIEAPYHLLYNYDVRFADAAVAAISDRAPVQIEAGVYGVKLTEEADALMSASDFKNDGITPIKAAAAVTGTGIDSGVSVHDGVNELYGKEISGSVYFNPLFAKEIQVNDSTAAAAAVKKLTVRSARQMLNMNKADVNHSEYSRGFKLKGYAFTQTIGIDFAYKPDGDINRNVVANFAGTYDGTAEGEDSAGRSNSYFIKNLALFVRSEGSSPYSNNIGSTFGDLATSAKVSNLEFIDPQILFDNNGRGGGIVSSINFGVIDNVKVYNVKEKRSLFAGIEGETDPEPESDSVLYFCVKSTGESLYGHEHGGIAAQSVGSASKIVNCTVGTPSYSILDVVNNKTQIVCCQRTLTANKTVVTNNIGGIAGFVYGGAQVVACANLASIDIDTDFKKISGNVDSAYAMGGIVGALGVRWDSYSYGNTHSSRYVAGFGGNETNGSPGYVVGCYNSGSLRSPLSWVAGIVGYPGTKSEIISCYNTGRVNFENDEDGELKRTDPIGTYSLRVGGISGETCRAYLKNCYNVGYISGDIPATDYSGAGAIMATASLGESYMENCYSLPADEYKPMYIVGRIFAATLNGIGNPSGHSPNNDHISNFNAGTFQRRAELRSNKELISPTYVGNSNPGLTTTPGTPKGYPVFTSDPSSFYIYPQMTSFTYKGESYKNPHIVPWEYIDAIYESTLRYYEKYGDGSFGFYSLDIGGSPESSLKDELVAEEGYFIEIGKAGSYKVEINGAAFTVSAVDDVMGTGKTGIVFTDAMKLACNAGYNKIRLFTTDENDENNAYNRIVGSSEGTDLYFDPMFPKELRYAPASAAPSKPDQEAYSIRSARHMSNIMLVGTENRTFEQECDISFDSLTPSGAVVYTEFKGIYDGGLKTIANLTIDGQTVDNVGLFSQNSGTIKNVILIPDTSITGQNNVGGIAGHNLLTGIIENCVVKGEEDSQNPGNYIGMSIKGNENVGGIAGKNDGQITGCTVSDTTHTVEGVDIVGGITGTNGTAGKITDPVVRRVTVKASGGTQAGDVCGLNENTTDADGGVENPTLEDVTVETGTPQPGGFAAAVAEAFAAAGNTISDDGGDENGDEGGEETPRMLNVYLVPPPEDPYRYSEEDEEDDGESEGDDGDGDADADSEDEAAEETGEEEGESVE